LRIATSIDESESTEAIERSKSPQVSGSSTPSARISSTVWLLNMSEKLSQLKKVLPRSIVKTAIISPHTQMSAVDCANSRIANGCRAPAGSGGAAVALRSDTVTSLRPQGLTPRGRPR